jgi:hypothetical protein
MVASMKSHASLFAGMCALVCASLFTSCASMCPMAKASPGQVEHVVLVWLKDAGNEAKRSELITAAKGFKKQIPGIISISAGTPLPSDRPVVDDSFDIGLVMRFESKEALAAYEKHPVHVKAVKEALAPASKKLQVYDVVVR